MRAVVEHGDPQQHGEREDRGHLHPPAGHPDRERPRPALPPRDPHRRRTGPNGIESGEHGGTLPLGNREDSATAASFTSPARPPVVLIRLASSAGGL